MFGSKINQRDEGQKRHARRTRAVDLSRAESWVGLGGSWSRGATRGHGPPTWRSRGAHAGPRVDASAHGRAEKVASATVKESRPARIPGPPRPSPHTPPPPRTTIAVASVDVAPPDHPTSADHTPWAPSPRFIKKKSTNPVMQKTKRKRTETTANYFSLSSSSLSRERKKEKKRKEKEREALERETRERVAAY